jgi:hypothetical protein
VSGAKITKQSQLTQREGKLLRYITSCQTLPVTPAMCIIQIPWSDLPKNSLQARAAIDTLVKYKLVERSGKGFIPTESGKELIKSATSKGWWVRKPTVEESYMRVNQYTGKE